MAFNEVGETEGPQVALQVVDALDAVQEVLGAPEVAWQVPAGGSAELVKKDAGQARPWDFQAILSKDVPLYSARHFVNGPRGRTELLKKSKLFIEADGNIQNNGAKGN